MGAGPLGWCIVTAIPLDRPAVLQERTSPSRPTSFVLWASKNSFVTLLSDQALEEEGTHAQQLREIADRLEDTARRRRHLAGVTEMKCL